MTYFVEPDGDGWGVTNQDGMFENLTPFKTRTEAEDFRAAIYQAHRDWEANQAYWSQTIFGE